jgi:hypothetical protein
MYITVILPVVLYGCETWFLTLEEKCMQGFCGETWRMKLRTRNSHGLENIVNVDPKEMGLDDVDWINLAQNRDK